MKLINLTFKKFPAKTADAIYVRKLSYAFSEILEKKFKLVVIKNESKELEGISYVNFNIRQRKFRFLLYVLQMLMFLFKEDTRKKDTVFFSNDQTLVSLLIIFRRIFFLKYKICFDWHMMVENWKDKFVVDNVDMHITTTEHLKNRIVVNLKANPKKFLVAYGGVDIDEKVSQISRFDQRVSLGLPEQCILVGYVGFFKTLGKEKGIKTMIDSLSYVSNIPNIKMAFIGGKHEEIEYYKNYVKEKGLEDKVIFYGVIPQENISSYQKAMDILVIPYPDRPHFTKYGFPMKTYEYLNSGNPIIYSNLRIINEVLENLAFSFEPDSPVSLANTIKYVLSHKEEAEGMANKARTFVRDLTWNKKANRIVTFIENSL